MTLTMLPSKKTRAEWSSGLLLIAQGNSVIELTPDQAKKLAIFICETVVQAPIEDGKNQDMGN